MELVYAAMLLHKAGKPINEENVKKVLDASGVKKDDAQVKALVAALEGVDIEKAIKEASVPVAAVAAAPSAGDKSAEKKEEKSEKAKEEEEAKATAGLGALFG
jgi:large subunit ribosomal protein L12